MQKRLTTNRLIDLGQPDSWRLQLSPRTARITYLLTNHLILQVLDVFTRCIIYLAIAEHIFTFNLFISRDFTKSLFVTASTDRMEIARTLLSPYGLPDTGYCYSQLYVMALAVRLIVDVKLAGPNNLCKQV